MITAEDIRAEISDGEGSVREFKATYRWNIKAARQEDALRFEVLKTIAGFLNSSSGGVLFIGVEDNGQLFGIQIDGYKSTDAFLLAIIGDAKNAMGTGIATYLAPSIHELEGKVVCRVQCWPATEPVFVKFGGQEDLFFVRTGPMTTKLKPSEIHGYVHRRWPSQGSNEQVASRPHDTSQPFYLTDILKALSMPMESIRSLALEVGRLQREGKISFIINTGPSRELSDAEKQYEARVTTFRETLQATKRVLSAFSTRDSDQANKSRDLLGLL